MVGMKWPAVEREVLPWEETRTTIGRRAQRAGRGVLGWMRCSRLKDIRRQWDEKHYIGRRCSRGLGGMRRATMKWDETL